MNGCMDSSQVLEASLLVGLDCVWRKLVEGGRICVMVVGSLMTNR